MTFAEAVDALKALADEGIVVEATVWGVEDDSYQLASLRGLLAYAPGDSEVLGALSGELRDAVAAAEIATVFEVGGSDSTHTSRSGQAGSLPPKWTTSTAYRSSPGTGGCRSAKIVPGSIEPKSTGTSCTPLFSETAR